MIPSSSQNPVLNSMIYSDVSKLRFDKSKDVQDRKDSHLYLSLCYARSHCYFASLK